MRATGLPRVSFVSLGCAKNLVDSEVVLGRLARDGWRVVSCDEDADVVVINSCGFLQAARQETLELFEEMLQRRRSGRIRGIVVAGCMPQRDPQEAAHLMAKADAILGVTSREHIVDVCREILRRDGQRGPARLEVARDFPRHEVDRDRLRLTLRHYAYLRISEGCNHTCAFCIIPQIKGRFRSKPLEVVLEEARELAAGGARELILIAQDTTSYGLDLYRRLALDELLYRLSEVEGIAWIRLLYCYPTYVTSRLIAAIARNPKVVRYVDMPIQHTRERVLRAMRRGITERAQKDLVQRMRQEISGLVLRTTVIVGFPGETQEEFEGLLADLEELRFERLGAFVYSREPGSRADAYAGHLPDQVRQERWGRLMRLQRRIHRQLHRGWIGREVEAIVDTSCRTGGVGRTYGDAPEVDPVITLRARGPLAPGSIVRVRVMGVRGYDLIGKVL